MASIEDIDRRLAVLEHRFDEWFAVQRKNKTNRAILKAMSDTITAMAEDMNGD